MTYVRVGDCERVQRRWFELRALTHGGEAWMDGAMAWTDGPDGLNLMFPPAISRDGVERGLGRARRRGLGIVGAWLGLEVDATPLADAGFEEGWSPWWMTADLAALGAPTDPRITLVPDTAGSARAWYATASARSPAVVVGQAWSFLDGDLVGVFDMDVREAFRRQGLGSGLARRRCATPRTLRVVATPC